MASHLTAHRSPYEAAASVRWRHCFDTCEQCATIDGELSRSYLPVARRDGDEFRYRCDRGHMWSCWYDLAFAEGNRFSDCPCADCREAYGDRWLS